MNKEYLNRLKHRLNRLIERRDKLRLIHEGNELNFTYWGGYELGYVKGQINEIEEFIFMYEQKE